MRGNLLLGHFQFFVHPVDLAGFLMRIPFDLASNMPIRKHDCNLLWVNILRQDLRWHFLPGWIIREFLLETLQTN